MKMKYFENVQTLDEAKKLYYALSKKLHPDLNPDNTNATKDFQAMNNEYDYFCATFSGEEKFKGEKESFDSVDFRNVIDQLLQIENIIIEITGSFIWCYGTNKSQKDELKNIKSDIFNSARWAPKKKMWYFSPKGYKRRGKKTYDIEDIRCKYGSTRFESQGKTKIAQN